MLFCGERDGKAFLLPKYAGEAASGRFCVCKNLHVKIITFLNKIACLISGR